MSDAIFAASRVLLGIEVNTGIPGSFNAFV
jgi:hypothetical protein